MPKQILLIHGEKCDAEAVAAYSWQQPYEITLVHTAEEAFALLDCGTWDVVAADPFIGDGLSGHLLAFKEKFARTPLVIMAPIGSQDQAMDLFEPHAAGFIQLPLNLKVLDFTLSSAYKTLSLNQKINRYSERIAQLHNAQDLLNQLFEEVPCFISVQDRDLKITAANKLFKEHFGRPHSGFCYEIYKHRNSPCPECPVAATFADGKSHTTEEVVTSRFGKQYNVLTQTAPIRNELGQITQVMEMSTDITQIRQLQDHLISLGLMLGSMSHGVKGMLTALDGGIYQLETGITQKDEARVSKAFGQIQQMSSKIKKMVLEILYYAKSRELNYERLDIGDFAKNVVDTVRPMAEKNDIQLSVSIPKILGKIEVDSNWMEAALVNFLENALDACLLDDAAKNHWIRFSVKKQSPGFIIFSIEDNGTGMDEETKNKMFTLFFSSKGSQGTGLGLYIANRVVMYHGGLIEVRSQPGNGSRFDICLPFEKPETIDTED